MTEKYFSFRNLQFSYAIHGEGPALVLLHGYTESKEIWYSFAEKLADRYTVVMPDLPGHGKSDLETPLSTELMAEIVDDLVKKLGIMEFTMIGHSMGGYVTVCYAELFGHKLNGFGLFHSNARADKTEVKENRFRIIDVIAADHGSFVKNFIPDLFFDINRNRLAAEIEELKLRASAISKEALIESQKAMADRQGSIELLAETHLPVLFIIGKHDSRIDFNQVYAQTILPKRSFVLLLENCGHMGYLEAPEDTLAAIEGFLLACNRN